MDVDDVLKMVIKKLNDLIFEIEQIKEKVNKKSNFTVEIKDSKGKVIKNIKIKI